LHKGFEIIPDILRSLKKNGNDFVLYTTISRNDWTVGYDSFEKDINSMGLKDNVVITGRISQEEIGVFYKYTDVMLYTSRCESFGFSMLEAIGYSLPIVAVDTPINREICGDAAFYFISNQPESGSRLLNNLRNPLLREELKINSKRRLTDFDWSWERSANQWIKIINQYGNG
jgi:glycosyltransferase involved in cell wall biosynthesis